MSERGEKDRKPLGSDYEILDRAQLLGLAEAIARLEELDDLLRAVAGLSMSDITLLDPQGYMTRWSLQHRLCLREKGRMSEWALIRKQEP